MERSSEAALVAELEQALVEARATRISQRRWQSGMSLTLVGVICSFLAAMYLRAEDMYAPENMGRCLAAEAEVLRPDVENVIRGVVSEAGPHYAQLGKERMESAMPELRKRMSAELTSLTADLADRAVDRIGVELAVAQNRQLERLRESFPHLQDDAAFQELSDRWALEIQADSVEVVVDFHERAMVDFATLEQTISSFRPNKYEDFDEEELVRYYAHLWLRLLDEEVVASTTKLASTTKGVRDDG